VHKNWFCGGGSFELLTSAPITPKDVHNVVTTTG